MSPSFASTTGKVPVLESNSVNFVPHSQRYGHPRSLFTLWFGANAMGVTILTGSLAAYTSLSLLWDAVAIVVGTLIGTVFVAYHSAQGPALGLPQMIQSRAQFGFYGAVIPLVVVVAMYLGFFGGGAVLAGDAMSTLTGTDQKIGILLISLLSLVLVTFGYQVLHVLAKIITPVFVVVFAIVTIFLIVKWPGGAHHATAAGGFSLVGFFLVLGIVAAYFITYGPYVADYSRYLPEKTSVASTFWYTYVGMSLSGIWLMILGAAVQIAYSQLGIVEALAAGAGLGGGWLRVLALLVLLIGLVNIGALNIYGAAMSLLTIATSFMKSWQPTRALRLAFMIPVAVIATIGSVVVSGDLINTYENFIFFLIAFLIPWSAVNLVDFYFVRKGRYHVGDLFTANGRYRSVSWAGVAAYLIGCAVMIPFISTTFYTGPLAAALGFDISWMVGLVVSGAGYALFARIARVRESDAAAAALDPKEAAETAAALAAAEASDDNEPHTSAKGS